MEALKQSLSLLLWAALLFAQHVTCFDIFNSDFGYLYLLAVISAAGQFGLLYGNRTRRILLCACGLAYSAVGVLKIPVTLVLIFQGGWRLSLLCLVLDLAGAAWSFRLAGAYRKRVIT